MPRNIERDKREADRRKNQLIEAGFRLFSQNGIETVSLQKVADAANVSPATMYKYFLTKEKLLIAISAKVWDEVWQEALGDPGTNHFEHFTAYQGIEFYADRMIALYKNRPEVLRFSGEYKTYMNRRGNMEDKQLREHLDVLKPMQLLFHGMYERAKVDGSIRTDIPEEEMFITSSITMLSILFGLHDLTLEGIVLLLGDLTVGKLLIGLLCGSFQSCQLFLSCFNGILEHLLLLDNQFCIGGVQFQEFVDILQSGLRPLD